MSLTNLTIRLVMGDAKEVVTMARSALVSELYEQAEQLLQKQTKHKKAASQSHAGQIQLLTGFPPRLLVNSADLSLHEAGIQSLQSVTIRLQPTTTSTEDVAARQARAAPKRAAAQKATAGFKDAIAKQDQLEKPNKQSKTSRTSSPNIKPRFAAASTTGVRLGDGAIVSPRRKKKATNKNGAGAIGPRDALESAAAFLTSASGGSRSKQARLMRNGWRDAVNSAYEQNKAVARLAAIEANKYQFSLGDALEAASEHSLETHIKTLQVTFDKGVQGRGTYTESVDYLPKAELSAALASIHATHAETLRPENMALLSPRVVWGLMYHYMADNDPSSSPSVPAAMYQLQPTLDWNFLRRRKEQLSSKARENLRQQEAKASAAAMNRGDSEMDDWARAAEAIESVERAMEDMQATGSGLLVPSAADNMEPWFVETPAELDTDELHACVNAHTPENTDMDWVELLQEKCDIHNWRELANEKPEDLSKALQLDEEVCQAWIDHAQAESVDEIICEVCGSAEAVELLREAANSGTPGDLSLWRLTVPLLKEALEAFLEETDYSFPFPSETNLQIWCNRAYQACEQLPWLTEYATETSADYGSPTE